MHVVCLVLLPLAHQDPPQFYATWGQRRGRVEAVVRVRPHTTWTSGPASSLRVPIDAASATDPTALPRLLTVREVAAACQLSEKAIRRAIEDGELAAVKLRSRLRVAPDDLRDWISGQRQTTLGPRQVAPRPHSARGARLGTFRALVAGPADDGERS